MPVMKRIHGKAYGIYERLMGTPPNKHCPVKRDPRISARDIERVLLAMSEGPRPEQSMMPTKPQLPIL